MANTAIEKYNAYLFDGQENVIKTFSAVELERFNRIKHTFTVWLDKPEMTDRQIRDHLETEFGIEKSQAYRDISILKSLLGNVRNAHKEWHRYTIIEMLKEAFSLAKEKKDAKAMAIAADKLGKYTNLDKEDLDLPNWEDFNPPEIEASDDITILDLEKMDPDEELRLREKYLGKNKEIEDAEVLEE